MADVLVVTSKVKKFIKEKGEMKGESKGGKQAKPFGKK